MSRALNVGAKAPTPDCLYSGTRHMRGLHHPRRASSVAVRRQFGGCRIV